MGKQGHVLTADERMQIVLAASRLGTFGAILTDAEIAELYGVSAATVKRTVRMALHMSVEILKSLNRLQEIVGVNDGS